MGFGESDLRNSGFGDFKFCELKFGEMEFGNLEGHRVTCDDIVVQVLR